MNTVDRIEQSLQSLQLELEQLAPSFEGTVSPGSVKFPVLGANLQVRFPNLKGTYGTLPVRITFSIVSDFSQLLAGQPVNKPTTTALDYLYPWLQVYAYYADKWCPFVLWVTPERTDIMTKITRALGLESRGLRLGWLEFDDRYFLDCRSGKEDAEAFLRMPGIREKIEALGTFQLLRFEANYVRLVTSVEDPRDYKAERMLGYMNILSELVEPLRPAGG